MRPICVARSAATCFPSRTTFRSRRMPGLPSVLYPYMEDSVKVRSRRSSRKRPSRLAFVSATLVITALAGAGSVPTFVAFAQMVEDDQMVIADAGHSVVVAESRPDPDMLRTPSGLGALEEKVSGLRTTTIVAKPAPAAPRTATPSHTAPRPAAAPAASAPSPAPATPAGDGWKTARASWYGPGFYGNTMAGGGVLTPDSMVVAHRTLPFGTRIEFSYKGRTCIAVVQDRGPFTAGRVFDLGPGTAKALGFSGVAMVGYRIL